MSTSSRSQIFSFPKGLPNELSVEAFKSALFVDTDRSVYGFPNEVGFIYASDRTMLFTEPLRFMSKPVYFENSDTFVDFNYSSDLRLSDILVENNIIRLRSHGIMDDSPIDRIIGLERSRSGQWEQTAQSHVHLKYDKKSIIQNFIDFLQQKSEHILYSTVLKTESIGLGYYILDLEPTKMNAPTLAYVNRMIVHVQDTQIKLLGHVMVYSTGMKVLLNGKVCTELPQHVSRFLLAQKLMA